MSRIAYRYAKSLLDLCIERKEVEAVSKDMAMLHSTLMASRDLELMLKSPVVKGDTKLKVMDKVFQSNIHTTTNQFIHLMTEKGREAFLKEIAESFSALVRKHNNEVLAFVTTAEVMSESTRQAILNKAQSLTTETVTIQEKVDADLIGGFIIRVGDKQLDASIASQIKQLKRDFSENEYVSEI
jgi:F-type H+-transporting ATPase subunit delta